MSDECGLMFKLQATGGSRVQVCIRQAIRAADVLRLPVEFEFNGVNVRVDSGSNPDDVLARWRRDFDAFCEAVVPAPQGKAAT